MNTKTNASFFKNFLRALMLAIVVLSASPIGQVLAAPGDIDPTFNYGAGTRGTNGTVYAVVVQADGKVIIGGSFNQYNGSAVPSGIIRLNTDGSLDTSFNNAGAGIGGGAATVRALALDSSGNVLVGGSFNQYNGASVPSGLIRLSSTGLIDGTFNSSGAGISGGWVSDTVFDLAIQPSDGRIVIGGDFTAYNGDATAPDLVMRVNTNGTRDSAGFVAGNGAGILNTLYPLCGRPVVYALALQPSDGRIVVGGNCFNAHSNDGVTNDLLASDNFQRLNTDGTLDTSFNYGSGEGLNAAIYDIAIQPANGYIVLGGLFTTYNGDANTPDGIMRVNTTGSRDTGFIYGAGTGVVNTVNATPEVVFALAIESDGKIIVGGEWFNAFNSGSGNDTLAADNLLRLNSDGTVDTGFSYGLGRGSNAAVRALAIQPSAPAPYNAKVWVGGDFTSYSGDTNAPDRIERLNFTAPEVSSIATADPNPTNAASVNFTVTFSESVSGGGISNFSLSTTGVSGASITGVTGSGITRTVTVNTGTGDGTIRLDMVNSTGVTGVGGDPINNLPFTTGEEYTIDKTAPTVSIGAPSTTLTSTGPVDFPITVSGANTIDLTTAAITLNTTGTATGTVSVTNGTTANPTVTISGITGDGTIGISIAAGVASDTAGNTSAAAGPSATFTVDNTAPTVSIGAPSTTLTSTGPVDFSITVSGANTIDLTTADITLNTTGTATGTVSVTNGATANPTVTISGITGDGTIGISIAAGVASDTAGNTSAAAGPSATFTVDNTAPTVSIGAPSVTLTSTGPVDFPITVFGANTINLITTDITLNTTGTATGTISVTNGATANPTVTISGITGDGTIGISIAAGVASDTSGNTSAAAGPSAAFTVNNTTAPVITSANNATFTVGVAGSFNVTTSGNPTPTISHTTGALPTGVTFTDNGNGTATLAGTPAAGTANTYTLTFVASNGVNPDANQTFTLTVNEAPAITSANNTAFVIGSSGSFTITTSGSPAVTTITIGGDALPANVTFTDNGNGTATLSGIPQAGTDGTYNLTFTASNGVGTDATQNFTLTVNQAAPPKIVTNGIGSIPDSGGGYIAEAEIVNVGVTNMLVTFDQAVRDAGSGDPDSVTNPANYILVRDNGDGIQTTTCAAGGGVIGGDLPITINSVTYNNGGGSGPFVATLNLNNGASLVEGAYRLIICGTTSIVNNFGVDLAGDGVNPGTDFTRNFVITFAASGGGTVSNVKSLPATGFPMGVRTDLPSQPAQKAYTAYGDMWLEIPKLGLKMSIVGVPQDESAWDVTWLGSSAGYLQGTAFPTWKGNTVLTAHVWDSYNNPGPFAKLKNLLHGDKVKIHAFGQVYTYEVRESRLVSPSNTSTVLKHEELDWVTLLTCEDYKALGKDYAYRRAVRAVLTNVESEK